MVLVMAFGAAAGADGVNTSNPNLPPDLGAYVNANRVPITYNGAGLIVVLQDLQLKPLALTAVRTNFGPDEREAFDVTLNGTASVNLSPPALFASSGSELTVTFNKVGNTTGTFNAEMLSLNLSGSSPFGPFMIRESPTLATTGLTSITNIGGGMFHIDSFFDVFTELSVDGGQSWIPSSSSTRMTLVPEPAAMGLMLAGSIALGMGRRRITVWPQGKRR
jgi:hypothetical protein